MVHLLVWGINLKFLTQPTPCHSEPKTLPNHQVTPVTKLLRFPIPPTHPRGRPSIHRNPGLGFRSRPDPDEEAALSIGVISCQATVSEPRPRTWIQKVVNKVSICRAGRRRIYKRCSPHFEGNSRSGRRDESLKRCYHFAGSQDILSFATPRYYLRY